MSQYFHYQQNQLFAENVALGDIAERFGTPCYVYSRAALTDGYRQFAEAFRSREHLICYAVKANSNLAILNLFARLGAGFDIVSGGELQRVLAAGGAANKVVFSGVGKSEAEMRLALEAGILCFNVESAPELDRLNAVAGSMGKVAPISLRVNPDVDAKTHPYISTGLKQNKFGVAYTEALALYRKAAAMPQPACHRHGLPHRFATDRDQPVHRGSGEGAGAGRPTGGRRHRTGTSRSGRRPRHLL